MQELDAATEAALAQAAAVHAAADRINDQVDSLRLETETAREDESRDKDAADAIRAESSADRAAAKDARRNARAVCTATLRSRTVAGLRRTGPSNEVAIADLFAAVNDEHTAAMEDNETAVKVRGRAEALRPADQEAHQRA
ncbi:hypothetical protein IWQ56_007188, partial [Coemansia nantahalensis]